MKINKESLLFINQTVIKNKAFIIFTSITSFIFLVANILFNIKLSLSNLKNVDFNSFSSFYIILFVSLCLLFISILSYYLFTGFRKNGLQIILQTHSISRKKIVFSKLIILAFYYTFYVLFNLISSIMLSVIFSNNQLAIMSLILIVSSLAIFFIFLPLFLFINIHLKGNLIIITITLFVFFIILSFFGFRMIGVKNNSDKLNYKYNVNRNNYFKMYDVDQNGNIKKEYLGIKRNNQINLSNNLNSNFINNINKIDNFVFNFSLGEMLVGIPSQIYDFKDSLFKDANHISKNNYIFNTKLIDTYYEGIGSPSLIQKINNPVVVSFQDQNPFELKYEDFQKLVFKFLDKLNINKDNDKIFINSLISKIANKNYYDLENGNFSEEDKNILKKLSGFEDSFIYYYLKYKIFFENKYSNIFQSIKEKYNLWVFDLIKNTWNNNLFIKNLISYKTIINPVEIEKKFPNLKILNDHQNMSSKDQNYFKNILIHFTASNSPKILEKLNSGQIYQNIDLTKLDPSIVDKKSWDKYIDNNLEVINANNIYQNLKTLDSKIPNKYVFDPNQIDIYSYDGLLKLKNKNWINNLYIHYFLLILLSSLCWFSSVRKIKIREDTYEK